MEREDVRGSCEEGGRWRRMGMVSGCKRSGGRVEYVCVWRLVPSCVLCKGCG